MAIFSALIFSASLFGSFSAQAVTVAGASTCNLEFEVKGRDIQILLGYSKLKGAGRIWCIDAAGTREELPIKVTIGTPLLFPRISFAPSLTVRGAASGIAILKGGPQVLLGKYNTIELRLAVGGGFGTSLALSGEDNGLAITLGLQDVEGFGIAVGGTIVTIE
jgi:hypothetical protein